MPLRPLIAFAPNLIKAGLCVIACWLPHISYAQGQVTKTQKPPHSASETTPLEEQSSQQEGIDQDNNNNNQHRSKLEQNKKQAEIGENEAKEQAKTIWLEEKLNPGTQWLENAVKPLTRWIEGRVQLKPKGNSTQPSQKTAGSHTKNHDELAVQHIDSGAVKILDKDDIRTLLKQRYSADVLHIKALGNGPVERYRVKMINQHGVIQILYLRATDGQEVPR